MPVNDFIDRTKLPDSSFNLTEEPFDFSISLRVFHTSNVVLDLMRVKKILEHVLSMFPVPGWNELGTMVGQDLARGPEFHGNPDSRL